MLSCFTYKTHNCQCLFYGAPCNIGKEKTRGGNPYVVFVTLIITMTPLDTVDILRGI